MGVALRIQQQTRAPYACGVLLGQGVVGEKYQLANIGTSALDVAENSLFKAGVMAVSVEQASLRPGEATNLFVIRERKSDD